MAYEQIKRNRYFNPTTKYEYTSSERNYYEDFEEFHRPLARMQHVNRHGGGIACGLEVSGTIGGTEIVIHSGVAIDENGQLISLSDAGYGDIGLDPPGDDHVEVPVPVHFPIDSHYASQTFYVTIQYAEILRSGEGAGGRWEQVPWIRLQPVSEVETEDEIETEDNEGEKKKQIIVLAIVDIGANGTLVELKVRDSEQRYRRRLLGERLEQLEIQHSETVEDEDLTKAITDIAGTIMPGDGGGLRIAVPKSGDSITFDREDGGHFANLKVCSDEATFDGKVGMETLEVTEQLQVAGNIRMTGQEFEVNNGQLRVTPDGHVGIGIANAGTKLDVFGEGKFTGNLSIQGHVGIGTDDPQTTLEVNGTLQTTDLEIVNEKFAYLDIRSSKDDAVIRLYDNDKFWSIHNDNSDGNKLDIRYNDSTRLKVTSDGNVGIGTTEPGAKLDVNGGAFLGYETTVSDFGGVLKSGFYQNGGKEVTGDVPDTSHDWTHLITARHSNQSNNHQLQIASSYKNNNRLFFRKIQHGQAANQNPSWHEIATRGSNIFSGTQRIVDGSVGIGTTDPKARLDIAKMDSHKWLQLGDGGDRGRMWVEYGPQYAPLLVLSDKDDPPRIRFQQIGDTTEEKPQHASWIGHAKSKSSDFAIMGGNIGIGTDPKRKLDVAGDIRMHSSGRDTTHVENVLYFHDGDNKYGLTLGFNPEVNRYRVRTFIPDTQDFAVSSIPSNADVTLHSEFTDRLVVRGNGNVGIGTTEPKAKLDVNGGAFLGYETKVSDFGDVLKSGFYQGLDSTGDVPDNSSRWTHLITARHSNQSNNHQLQIASSYKNNNRLFFRKIQHGQATNQNPSWHEIATRGSNTFLGTQRIVDGNVGIGTDSPKNKLDVKGKAVIGANYSGTKTAPINGLLVQGNVGIGTDSPKNKLDVKGKAVIGANYSGTKTAPTNGLLVQGNVGIGTTDPKEKLEVKGHIKTNRGFAVVANVPGVKIRYGTKKLEKKPESLLTDTITHGESFSSKDSYFVIAKVCEVHGGSFGGATFRTFECKPVSKTQFIIRWKHDWGRNYLQPIVHYLVIGT